MSVAGLHAASAQFAAHPADAAHISVHAPGAQEAPCNDTSEAHGKIVPGCCAMAVCMIAIAPAPLSLTFDTTPKAPPPGEPATLASSDRHRLHRPPILS